jgi:hypothetical protein
MGAPPLKPKPVGGSHPDCRTDLCIDLMVVVERE